MLDRSMELVIPALGALAVGLVFGLGHFVGGLFKLMLKIDQRRETRLRDFEQRLLGLEVDFLPQKAHAYSRPHEQPAVIGLIDPGKDLHEGGLAGAIWADQPDPLAGADFEFQLTKD